MKTTFGLFPHFPLQRPSGEILGPSRVGDRILLFDFVAPNMVEGEIWDERGPWATCAIVADAAVNPHDWNTTD